MANNRLTNEWGEWEGEPPKGLLYQGNITGKGFGGETMRGAHPRAWQTDPSDTDWNMFGNPMQDRMAPDLSGEDPSYIQDGRKYIGDERYDEEEPRELAKYYQDLAAKGIGLPQNAADRPDPVPLGYYNLPKELMEGINEEGNGPIAPWHKDELMDTVPYSKALNQGWEQENVTDKLKRYAEEANMGMDRQSSPNPRMAMNRERFER